jgi:mannose-6-phosphate isomerase-like protein (cupin superfamily)
MKNGFITNIEKGTLENESFRKVIYTAEYSQLVLMSLNPGEEIGEEIHDVDQFLRIESGKGEAVLNGNTHVIEDGSAIVVPKGTKHNVINKGEGKMKLYSLYTPPHHRDGIIHETKEGAEKDDEHFDGKTTE